MNWVIRYSKKMTYHTNLRVLIEPLLAEINDLNWLVTDLEYNGSHLVKDLPVNYDHDYFILTPHRFFDLIAADMQIIWGIFLGFPKDYTINVDPINLPYAESDHVWNEGHIQHEDAVIEIICFDSSYTIVKFRDRNMSDIFKAHFTEAIDLKSFIS
jgi:hypothetical protein